MVPRIGRAAQIATGVAALSLIVAGVRAQDSSQPAGPPLAPPSAPAPVAVPSGVAAPGADANSAAANPAPASPATPAPDADDSSPAEAANAVAPAVTDNTPKPPPPPPTPDRAPVAILRVLDKVTAETMAFEAPIRQRVRYKSLIFEVKACETRGQGDPQPQPSAYLVITSDAGAAAGGVIGPRQVFKGWMFANAPSVHALTHPVYDAWLVSCSTAAPGV